MEVRQVGAHLLIDVVAEPRQPGLAEDIGLLDHDQAIVAQILGQAVEPMTKLRDRHQPRVVDRE